MLWSLMKIKWKIKEIKNRKSIVYSHLCQCTLMVIKKKFWVHPCDPHIVPLQWFFWFFAPFYVLNLLLLSSPSFFIRFLWNVTTLLLRAYFWESGAIWGTPGKLTSPNLSKFTYIVGIYEETSLAKFFHCAISTSNFFFQKISEKNIF